MLMDAVKPADLQATRVLSLDAAGRILDWISWQDAVCLYVRDVVAWTLGDPCLTVHGGHNRALGTQSLLQLHPIIASTGHCRSEEHTSELQSLMRISYAVSCFKKNTKDIYKSTNFSYIEQIKLAILQQT